MAEGLVGGALGGEEEKPEVEAPGALAGAEAFAAAVSAIASRQDPEVARDTSAFLKEQTRLLQTQRHHLDDEHALRVKLLRGQRLGQAIRIAFQIVVALMAIVIGVGVAVMLHDAFTSRGVVVEPFEAPPALVARGLTGTVVAGAVLDELTRLQRNTHPTNAAKRTLSSAWAHEIRLAVPETGLSLGEITRLLKARFGQEVHVEGDVVELDRDQVALTIHGDGFARKTFTGAVTEMDRLESRASDYIYAESQPRLWAIYLAEHDRLEELLDFIKSWYPTVDPADRPNLLLLLGRSTVGLNPTEDNRRENERDLRAALNLDPSYWVAYSNLVHEQIQEGDEERAWQTGIELGQAADGTPGRASDRFFESWYTLVRDIPGQLRADALEAANTGNRGLTSDFRPLMAINLVAAHDLVAAELELQFDKGSADDAAFTAALHVAQALWALESGEPSRAASEIEAFSAMLAQPTVRADSVATACWIVPIEEAAGHPEKADAALKAVTHRYLDCERFRGDLLDHRSDWAGAQRAYADAVALAPDLPAGYYSWGMALARHGDLAGAEAKLKDASQRGPHWADPLKGWGDALFKQGKTKEAHAKYDEALKYAPNWKQLKEAREAAEKQKT